MKEVTSTLFQCKCGISYSTKQQALECEERHKQEEEEGRLHNCIVFELKQAHLDLMKQANISWDDCEFGAPCLDPKRPYGNSDVENDIADIVGIEDAYDEDEDEWDEKKLKQINRIHKEMQIALEIVLHCQSFKLGHYKRKDAYSEWEKL